MACRPAADDQASPAAHGIETVRRSPATLLVRESMLAEAAVGVAQIFPAVLDQQVDSDHVV
jgi:hypothetical protein